MDEQDDLTLVYMWAYKMAEKKYKSRIEKMETALRHCVNAISEWERKPEGVDGFLLGAMDNARAALGEKKDG
jgi:hypothetical protein